MTIFERRPNFSAKIGLLIVAINLIAALCGPWLAPYGESQSIGNTWDPPSTLAWLGTDQIGRDMFTRLLYGARLTIGIALVATLLSFVIGVTLGFTAAIMGKWLDLLTSRLIDIVLSIPLLIFALIILGVMGSSLTVLVVTIAVLDSTRVFRLARASAMNIAILDFVDVAKLRGEGLWWVIFREILPNAAVPLVSEFGLRLCFNILFVAALSFLGLGVQPPYADWGGMVHENAAAINFGILAPFYPAMAIALLTVGINLVIDWLLSIDVGPSGIKAEL
jgi:peptide/nickel transport system permease protein